MMEQNFIKTLNEFKENICRGKTSTEIKKEVSGDEVLTLKDISEILQVPKYYVKNKIKEYGLQNRFVKDRVKYFSTKRLVPFLDYLIYQEQLDLLKSRVDESINKSQKIRIEKEILELEKRKLYYENNIENLNKRIQDKKERLSK